jgi:transposase
MGPSMSIQGSSDTESFSLYLREVLAPSLRSGQIVLMDNLSVHKSAWVRGLRFGHLVGGAADLAACLHLRP